MSIGILLAFAAFAKRASFCSDRFRNGCGNRHGVELSELTFVTDAAVLRSAGTGTSAATIAFGAVQAYGGSVRPTSPRTVTVLRAGS